MFLNQREADNNKCKMKIFDMDEQKFFTRPCYLRIISSLTGMSQYSCGNSLYLCGIGTYRVLNSTGSYLLRFDLEDNFSQPTLLVNTTYIHYNPMMVIIDSDIILVIGGKNQVLCEKYSISLANWKKMPLLPEERYQGNLFVNEKDSHLYLFGGTTKGIFNDSILKLNLRTGGGWSKINITGSYDLLRRYNCISFSLGNESDIIYICGGVTDENVQNDFIVEYNPTNNKLKKKYINSQLTKAVFEIQTIDGVDKKYLVFSDSNDNLYLIEKRNFKITVLTYRDLLGM